MPESTLSERAARAALAAHFAPEQVAADLADHSPAEVWQRRVRRDNSGRLAQYKPREELDKATLTCRFVIPSDDVWPTALADLGPHRPLGLWNCAVTAQAFEGGRAKGHLPRSAMPQLLPSWQAERNLTILLLCRWTTIDDAPARWLANKVSPAF